MALPLTTQRVTSFACNAVVEPAFRGFDKPAGFRMAARLAIDAVTESTCCKSFADKRQCHSRQRSLSEDLTTARVPDVIDLFVRRP